MMRLHSGCTTQCPSPAYRSSITATSGTMGQGEESSRDAIKSTVLAFKSTNQISFDISGPARGKSESVSIEIINSINN